MTAWALLALAGTIIFFGFLEWIFPTAAFGFVTRVGIPDFTGIAVLASPLLAVLVATKVGEVLSQAKLISLVALAEYAAALLFGVLAFLFTLAAKFENLGDGIYAFGGVLQGIGGIISDLLLLGLLALAALWVYPIFTSLGGKLPTVNIQSD